MKKIKETKKDTEVKTSMPWLGSGGRTRTSGLRVMSPTSYQLLYPAMLLLKQDLNLRPSD